MMRENENERETLLSCNLFMGKTGGYTSYFVCVFHPYRTKDDDDDDDVGWSKILAFRRLFFMTCFFLLLLLLSVAVVVFRYHRTLWCGFEELDD